VDEADEDIADAASDEVAADEASADAASDADDAAEDTVAAAEDAADAASDETAGATGAVAVVVAAGRLKMKIRPMMTITATMMIIQVLRFMAFVLWRRLGEGFLSW
jgi:hypothetical protein